MGNMGIPPHKQTPCTNGHHSGFTNFTDQAAPQCARCGAPPAEANGIDTDTHHVNGVLQADGTWRATIYDAQWAPLAAYEAATWEAAAELCRQHVQVQQTCDWLGMDEAGELAGAVMA